MKTSMYFLTAFLLCFLLIGSLSWSQPVKHSYHWINLDIDNAPKRSDMGYAYDSARFRGVIFGGYQPYLLNDTWEWDSSKWIKINRSGPSPRASLQMAYDEARGEIILFGGYTTSDTCLSDTWSYDGSSWTKKSPSNSPPQGQITLWLMIMTDR